MSQRRCGINRRRMRQAAIGGITMKRTPKCYNEDVGAFAEYVIKNVVKSIRAEHAPELSIEDIKKRIELIDEPIMKQLLIDEYTMKYDKELKRLYLEEELRKLERGENHVEA